MGEAARRLDLLDVRPVPTEADVAALDVAHGGLAAPDMLRALVTGAYAGRVALVSSFGAESAVLLHMVAAVDRDVPVIFVNTQKMFGETLAYRDELAERLGLTDLRVFRPDPRLLAARDGTGLRWSYDPDGCCGLRKVEPLGRALAPFDLWISGRKGFQSGTRAAITPFELDRDHRGGPKIKANPLAGWTRAALDAYAEEHRLPRHPLEAQGYPSIGCAPCTSKVQPGEDPRAGRWRGWDKVECGIHSPLPGPQADDPIF